MIKILIIEDHKILIDGIRALIAPESECRIVYEAVNGASGLDIIKTCTDIDVVLLDINLPDMSGIEICKEIRKIEPTLPILTLTMYESASYIKDMVNAGANGYILKDTSAEEFVLAVQTVAKGKTYLSERAKKIVHSGIDKNPLAQNSTKKTPRLTARETEVLKYIIREYTTDEIAKQLFISSHTVISHRKNILRKLNVKNTAGIVKTVYENDILIKQILGGNQ